MSQEDYNRDLLEAEDRMNHLLHEKEILEESEREIEYQILALNCDVDKIKQHIRELQNLKHIEDEKKGGV